MRGRTWLLIAGCAVGAVGISTLGVSCSSDGCAPGTLLMRATLRGQAPIADTITVTADDIGAILDASYPHTPNLLFAGLMEEADIVVTWPQGYPAGHLVNLHIVALADGYIVGVDDREVRLGDKCTMIPVSLNLGDGGAQGDDFMAHPFDLTYVP